MRCYMRCYMPVHMRWPRNVPWRAHLSGDMWVYLPWFVWGDMLRRNRMFSLPSLSSWCSEAIHNLFFFFFIEKVGWILPFNVSPPWLIWSRTISRFKRESNRPICHINAGYSVRWCGESFGVPLEAREITCRAQGDEKCTFLMSHRSTILQRLQTLQMLLSKGRHVEDVKPEDLSVWGLPRRTPGPPSGFVFLKGGHCHDEDWSEIEAAFLIMICCFSIVKEW